MFRRNKPGSFPNSNPFELDESFTTPMCGQSVGRKLLPKRKSSFSPKALRGTWEEKSSESPRKQRKFRKKLYYEELDVLMSPDQSEEEDGGGLDEMNILDYDDPDLEAPVFWEANDKVLEEQIGKIMKKRSRRTDSAQTPDIILSPSNESLPAVSESHEEETDSLSSDGAGNPGSTEPKKKKASNRGSCRGTEDDKDRVLIALRDLVLQQQKTLKKMATKNKGYKHRLAACQDRVLALKQEQLDLKDQTLNLELDRESVEAESLWMKEEVVTLRNELVDYKARQDHYKTTIALLQEENQMLREQRKSIMIEARQARSDLRAIAGSDADTEESSALTSDAGLRNEVEGLCRLISNLQTTDGPHIRRDSKDHSLPGWLDVAGATAGTDEAKPGVEEGRVLPPQNDELQRECFPRFLDLAGSGEQVSVAELTVSSETSIPTELQHDGVLRADDRHHKFRGEGLQHNAVKIPGKERIADARETRDESRSSPAAMDFDRRSSPSTPKQEGEKQGNFA